MEKSGSVGCSSAAIIVQRPESPPFASLSTLHIQISRFQRRCIHVSFLKLKKGGTAGLNP